MKEAAVGEICRLRVFEASLVRVPSCIVKFSGGTRSGVTENQFREAGNACILKPMSRKVPKPRSEIRWMSRVESCAKAVSHGEVGHGPAESDSLKRGLCN
jgi:hypothetical protein